MRGPGRLLTSSPERGGSGRAPAVAGRSAAAAILASGGPSPARGSRGGGARQGSAAEAPFMGESEGRQRAQPSLGLPLGSEAAPAEPRPGPSPPAGSGGGCRARPGRRPRGGLRRAARGRAERGGRAAAAGCRCCRCAGAGRQRGPGRRERERAGPRRCRCCRRCGSGSLPQWGWAAERAGRGKGQAPPPR